MYVMVPMLPGIPGKPGNSQISLPVGKKSGIWLIITEIRQIVIENRDKQRNVFLRFGERWIKEILR